jgi:hypothetical protein
MILFVHHTSILTQQIFLLRHYPPNWLSISPYWVATPPHWLAISPYWDITLLYWLTTSPYWAITPSYLVNTSRYWVAISFYWLAPSLLLNHITLLTHNFFLSSHHTCLLTPHASIEPPLTASGVRYLVIIYFVLMRQLLYFQLIKYLPELLEPLFFMLDDSRKDFLQATFHISLRLILLPHLFLAS